MPKTPPVPPAKPKLPTPVIGSPGGEPVVVTVEEPEATAKEKRATVQAQTAQESETTLRTEGQRKISLLWEAVHAVISVMVTGGTIFIAGRLVLRDDGGDGSTAFLLLSNAFFMVVSSYFARTNHTRVGGVGKEYEGR